MTHFGKYSAKFSSLRDVAIGPNEEIIIVDNGNRCVVVLDCKFNLLTVFGSDTMTDPCCVAFGNGIIAISDQVGSHQVKKYTLQGEFISVIGQWGTKIGEFDYPRGLTFNNGNLYVVDGFNYRVQVFQQDEKVFSFGRKGTGPGKFISPLRIANDSNHNILVSDYANNCISQFSCTGQFVRGISCINPWAITVTPDKHLITSHCKETSYVICIWDPNYQLINEFGGNFYDIRGIKIDSSGNIFMVDHKAKQLSIFSK